MQRFYVDQDGKRLGAYDGPDEGNPFAGAVESTPFPDDRRKIWQNNAWVLPAPTKAELRAAAAAKRWELEVGGITIGNPAVDPVRTDLERQNRITGACVLLNNDTSIEGVDFKTENGGVYLTRAQMFALGKAVGRHVQDCFTKEMAIIPLIESGAIATLEAVETWPGWA